MLVRTRKATRAREAHSDWAFLPAPTPSGQFVVHQSPISASGCVEGLPAGKQYLIQAFIITDTEYPEGSSAIQDGSWNIDAIWLGAVDHHLFFRIFDAADDTMIVQSLEMLLVKH